MRVLSFDLELNQANTGPKIIEIGACIGDTNTGEIISTYSCFVNPNEKLEEKIIMLTTITQQDVDSGKTLVEAYLGLESFAKNYDCLAMPIVWGCGDGHALRSELPEKFPWNFSHRELDVKAVYQTYQISTGGKIHSGLKNSMKKLKMNFVGTPHRAQDDAINTFLIFCELLHKFKALD